MKLAIASLISFSLIAFNSAHAYTSDTVVEVLSGVSALSADYKIEIVSGSDALNVDEKWAVSGECSRGASASLSIAIIGATRSSSADKVVKIVGGASAMFADKTICIKNARALSRDLRKQLQLR